MEACTSSSRYFASYLKHCIWKADPPAGAAICAKELSGEGLHRWSPMIGYCLKDHVPGNADFRAYHKGLTSADLEQGRHDYALLGKDPIEKRIILDKKACSARYTCSLACHPLQLRVGSHSSPCFWPHYDQDDITPTRRGLSRLTETGGFVGIEQRRLTSSTQTRTTFRRRIYSYCFSSLRRERRTTSGQRRCGRSIGEF